MIAGSAIVIFALVIFAIVVIAKSVRIVPQARAAVVERLGKYSRTLSPGLNFTIPFLDKIRDTLDLREQVVSFPPQPVITEDNLVVSIDTVVYFAVTDPRAATYEIANFIQGVEQLTTTTLRNVVGGMNLEQTLTSRDEINSQLRAVLDEATGKWGLRVGRVELKSIDPPESIQSAMETQMRAERNRRAAILTAEGEKRSAILTAEGAKEAAVLRAEGEAQAKVLSAKGEAEAIQMVFSAVKNSDLDERALAYTYLQKLPELSKGAGNTTWVVPADLSSALGTIGAGFSALKNQTPDVPRQSRG